MKGRFNLTNLKKHYEFIKSGNLIHKKFDFRVFNTTDNGIGECGTRGCSFGEIPGWNNRVKFSDNATYEIHFDLDGVPTFNLYIAKEIFGIDYQEYSYLFIGCYADLYGGNELYLDVTKEQVNENLRIFIEKVEKGEIV